MSQLERAAVVKECIANASGLVKGLEFRDDPLAPPHGSTPVTRRWNGVKVVVTDGPFAETKELLGGIGRISLRETDH